MSSAFRQIALAVVAALQAAPALAGGRVSLPLRRPAPPEWQSYIEVRTTSATGDRRVFGAGGPARWETLLTIDIYTRAAPGQAPDAALDDLLCDVHQRVQALDLTALRVAAIDQQPVLDWDWHDGDTPQALGSYRVLMQHDVHSANLNP
jgi:hypothetical protein